ncbi:MAG: lipid II:glycine glycyltransferase FemX [Actinomycetota bacterium]
MQAVIATETDRARFDAFVASQPHGDALQSWAWGEVKRASGWVPIRLMVLDDSDSIVATCQMLRLTPLRGVPPIVYAPRGPVLGADDQATVQAVLQAVRAHSGNAYLFTCDPPLSAQDARGLLAAGMQHVTTEGFGGVQPRAVMTLNLTPGADQVFSGFRSKWRYNCRLAERKGVKIREGSREDLPAFYEILTETAKRDRFLVRGLSYFERIWDELGAAGMLRLLLAELEGQPLAGIMLFQFGSRVTYVYGASSNSHREVMPNHLLQWTAIRDAAEAGFATYDFRGVSPEVNGEPVEEHLAGLNRFKAGFGASYQEYVGTLDLPLRRGWYWLWRTLGPKVLELRRRRAGGH